METWENWFRRAKSTKDALKDAYRISDSDIAAVVNEACPGKELKRGAINHWLNGKRDPSIREFMALCLAIGADPGEILFKVRTMSRDPKPLAAVPTKKRAIRRKT